MSIGHNIRMLSPGLHYIFSCVTLLVSLVCLAVFYIEMGELSEQLEHTRYISEKKTEVLKDIKQKIDRQEEKSAAETLSSLVAMVSKNQFITLDSDNADAAEEAFTMTLRHQLTFFIIVITIMVIIRSLYVAYCFYNMRNLRRYNMIDPLTGAWNRNYLATVERAENCYILAIDFDNFKCVNDQWGHAFGDYVLKQCTNLMVSETRNDIVIRMGGDEFIVLLNNVDAKKCWSVAERLRSAVSALALVEPGGTIYHPSLSIGLSPFDRDLEAALNIADINLYRSKQRGKGMITG